MPSAMLKRIEFISGVVMLGSNRIARGARRALPLVVLLAISLLPIAASMAIAKDHDARDEKPGGNPQDQFDVAAYMPLSRTLVSGSGGKNARYDYSYKIAVVNQGTTVTTLTATASSKSDKVQILQPDIHFGPIEGHDAADGIDTLVVRARCGFDPSLDAKDTAHPCHVKDNDDRDDDRDHDKAQQGTQFSNKKLSDVLHWTFTVPANINGMTPNNVATTNLRPVIRAEFEGTDLNTHSIVLSLDGAPVSSKLTLDATNVLSYTPGTDLATGEHVVGLSIADSTGQVVTTQWRFTILSIPQPTDSASGTPATQPGIGFIRVPPPGG